MSTLAGRLLFGLPPYDPPTYVALAVTLMGMAIAAAYLPARLATALRPLDALR